MMSILVIVEHDNDTVNPATLNTVAAAQAIGGDIHAVIAGHNCSKAAEAVAAISGISKVIVSDAIENANGLAENIAPLLASMANIYSHILAPATTYGKNIMPRVAALCDTAQISDIIAVIDKDTFQRPIYAGNALATVKSDDALKIITVRSTAFEAAADTGGTAAVEQADSAGDAGLSSFEKSELSKSERPELTSAGIVVSGGAACKMARILACLKKLLISSGPQLVLLELLLMRVLCQMIIRLARQARWLLLIYTWLWVFPVRSSIWLG